MFRLLKCLGCDDNSKTVVPEPIIPDQLDDNKDNDDNLKFLHQRKFSQSTYFSSQASLIASTSSCRKNETSEQRMALEFIDTLKNKSVQQRRQQESQFIKTHCFDAGSKFLIQNEWSRQYTYYLQQRQTKQLRSIDNYNLIEGKTIKSGLKLGKDYFVVSKLVWMFIKHVYGGAPEIEQNRMLPIKELSSFGLQNNRYSCFFNSGFQALVSIPQFVDYFYEGHFKDLKHKTKYPSQPLSTLTHVTLKHLSTAVSNDSFELGSLKKFIELKFSPSEQHDCQQLMRYYIQRLQQQLNPKPHTSEKQVKTKQQSLQIYQKHHISIIDTLFQGQIISQIKCSNCQHLSSVIEPIMEITLEMKSSSLQQSLDHHFSPQRLMDLYYCERCDKQSKATLQFHLHRAPIYLMITIKRFLQNRTKNYQQLAYEQTLDLSYYFKRPYLNNGKYTLQTVIIHSGSINKGHYYILTKRQDKWYQINDRRVKRINIEDYLQTQAYILIYRQIQ